MTPPFAAPYAGARLTPTGARGDRGERRDASGRARCLHRLTGCACEEERRLHVRVDLPVPGLLGHVDERLAAKHPGREDDRREAARQIIASSIRRPCPDRSFRSTATTHDHRPAGSRRRRAHLGLQVHGTDAGTDVREGAGGRFADALGGACHDDARALEPPALPAPVHACSPLHRPADPTSAAVPGVTIAHASGDGWR